MRESERQGRGGGEGSERGDNKRARGGGGSCEKSEEVSGRERKVVGAVSKI